MIKSVLLALAVVCVMQMSQTKAQATSSLTEQYNKMWKDYMNGWGKLGEAYMDYVENSQKVWMDSTRQAHQNYYGTPAPPTTNTNPAPETNSNPAPETNSNPAPVTNPNPAPGTNPNPTP